MLDWKVLGREMEAIAASFVEGAVRSLVWKLSAMLLEESRVLEGVREEVQYIKDELDSMSAFLRGVEEQQIEGDDDSNLKAWVKQVRDLIYDTEDCIDTFVLRFGQPQNHHRCSLRGAISSIKSTRSRCQIVAEINRIKVSTQKVNERRHRYERRQQQPLQSCPSAATTLLSDPRLAALFVEESELVGMEKPRDVLLRWLIQDEPAGRLGVLSVLGMGGLGKTTVARKVYDSLGGDHFYCRAWVTVSQSLDIKGVLRNMVSQLFPPEPLPPGLEKLEVEKLIEELRDNLHAKRYAVVFDDIWSTAAWDSLHLALPENGLGSKIIVTTRKETVARHCSLSPAHIYRLPTLSMGESRDLFCKKLYKRTTSTLQPPPHLEDLCDGILNKCGGLPLAIVTIGALLATKPQTREEWQKLHDNLGPELEANPSLDGLKQIISLSYNDLPYHLKPCFLYLSMFPESLPIRRSRLLRLWIAEGFVGQRHGMTPKEVAGDYYQELVNRSLIQPSTTLVNGDDEDENGIQRSCRVHDVMLEVIISKSLQENFISLLGEHRRRGEQDKVRRLSINGSHYVERNMNLSTARSLIVFGDGIRKSVPSSLIVLRVLDLEDCRQLEDDHLNKISTHIHLKYLSLRRTSITKLPETLGKLRNLETLDIRNTYIESLPRSIIKLRKLRYLLAGEKYHGSNSPADSYGMGMPQGMGSLKTLETLELIDISRGGVIEDLAELTQLRKLSVCGLTRENDRGFWAAFEKMSSCLRYLRASAQSVSEEGGLLSFGSINSPPVQLVSLKLMGRLQVLPSWFAWLKNIAEINLYGSELRDESLKALEALPSLIDLRLLWRAYIGKELCFGAQGFRSLKILHLSELEELETIRIEEENNTLINLENIWIANCPSLKEGPSGFEHFPSIKEIGVSFISRDAADILERNIRASPRKPRLKLGFVY